jgi:uridine kinase
MRRETSDGATQKSEPRIWDGLAMNPEEAVRKACALIDGARSARGGVIVAIDGAGGAGKSTLANGIRAALGHGSIVQVDDFYRPLSDDQRAALDPRGGYERYFDWRRMRDCALVPLRAGTIARYRRYDWTTNRLAEWIEVAPCTIVMVDGVYSMRPEFRELIDVAIFVDTPRAERRDRMTARGHNPHDWIERWMAAEDWYLENVKPARHADLIVEGI